MPPRNTFHPKPFYPDFLAKLAFGGPLIYFQIMQKYHTIWCDGSYRSRGGRLGTAFVSVAPNGTRNEGYRTLPPLRDTHNHGSDIAEISAFIDALNTLPDGAQARVYMDCNNVIHWLDTERLDNKGKFREPRIRKLFEDAVRAKKRMRGVEILRASDKTSPNMGWTHILSRRATAPEGSETYPHADQNPRHTSRPRNP